MRYLEYKHQSTALGRAYDWLGNALTIPTEWVVPVLAVQYGYGSTPEWSWRNLLNLKIYTGKEANGALYQNGLFYARLMLPFWIGLHIRWGSRFIQLGAFWKLIGRPAIHCRIQSDTSDQGGLATGFQDGPK